MLYYKKGATLKSRQIDVLAKPTTSTAIGPGSYFNLEYDNTINKTLSDRLSQS